MIFSSIEQSRTSREVERQIETLILEGVLRVGDKLPGERELSREFNVSRPILREALASLETRNLLVAQHGGGTYVADVIGTVFAPPVVELIGSNPKAKSDYLEYRLEIEGIASAMAAKRATEADKSLLSRIMQDMEAAHEAQDAEREAELDVEFHSAIGECAHNIILLHTLRSCYKLLSDDVFLNRETIYGTSAARNKLLDQHKTIFSAIVEGDSDAASKAAADHIIYIEQATREVERKGDWSAISELRLAQRHGQQPTKTKRRAKPVLKGASS